jgi:hypothetical protein
MAIKPWLKLISTISLDLCVSGLLVELGLRLVPTLIPAALLVHFTPELRSQIAAGRFPTADQAVAFIRDDGGFPFSIWQPFAEINYSFRDPGTVNRVVMDEMGFCNLPNTYSQQKHFDVVAVGDSMMWCTTVRPADTWVAQLAQQTDLSAYNLGKSEIGLYEYLQLLERFGLSKQPQVVIFNVYEGNDLRDAIAYQRYRSTGSSTGPLTDRKPIPTEPIQQTKLLSQSYSWNALQAMLQSAQPEARETGSSETTSDEADSTERENFRYQLNFPTGSVPFNIENGDRDEITYAKKLASGEVSLTVLSEALIEFAQLAEREGFVPIVTYTPSAYTAYAEVVAFEQPNLAPIMSAYSQQQREFLAAQSVALGYQFIDFTPVLQAVAADYNTPEKLLYYPTNRHLTRQGHAVIAQFLSKVIPATARSVPSPP